MPTYLEVYARQNQVQIQQLALLNHQFQQQQQLAAFQANLSQALFETERVARRVHNTLSKDVLAAAIIASGWGRRIQGLHAGQFGDVQAKHAWTHACTVLDGAVRAARNDGRLGMALDGYAARLDRLNQLANRIGQLGGTTADIAGSLGPAQHRVAEVNVQTPAYVVGGGALLTIVFYAASLGPLGVLALVGTAIATYVWYDTGRKKAGLEQSLHAVMQAAHEYDAFQRDDDGGGWLRGVWSEHPLILNEPAEEAPSSQAPASSQIYVERKLVERQIVVVRCRFCRQLAPVDLPTCEHCGAAGFGS